MNSRGGMYFSPLLRSKQGKDISYDDFSCTHKLLQAILKKRREKIKEVVKKSVHALGIRSCCAHVEFYKTKKVL